MTGYIFEVFCLAEKGARSLGKRRRSTTQPVLKEEKIEVKQEKDDVHDEEKKEDGRSNSEEASAGGSSTNFTPRSFQSGVFIPLSQPFSQVPSMPLNSPSFTPSFRPYNTHLLCGQMPWPQPVLCGACQAWGTVHPCLFVSWSSLEAAMPASDSSRLCLFVSFMIVA